MSTLRLRLFTWTTFFIVNFVIVGTAIFIRPIADDYCSAYGVKLGLMGYITRIFNTWSGDLTQVIANALFVGFPIAHFPLVFVGVVVQIFSVGLIVLSFFMFLRITFNWPEEKLSLTLVVMFIAGIEILWLLYWALSGVFSVNPSYSRILDGAETFSAIQGWPTAIVQYSVVPFALFVILNLMEFQKRKSIVGWLTLGIVFGFAGYVLALTSLATLLACKIFRLVPSIPKHYYIFILGIFCAALISFLSPGARGRTTTLAPFELSQFDTAVLARWFFISLFEFITSFINIGVFAVVGIVYLLGNKVITCLSPKKSENVNWQVLKMCFVFLFLYYVLISLSELLTYPAFWHLITFKISIFIAAIIAGLLLAKRFPLWTHHSSQGGFGNLSLGLALIASLVFVILPANRVIIERGLAWQEGSSALPGISDISENWVLQCWLRLDELRDFSRKA